MKLLYVLLLIEVGVVVAMVVTVRRADRPRLTPDGWQVGTYLSTWRLLLAIALMVLAIFLLMWMWFLWMLDPDPHRAVMDEFAIPPSWQFADEEVNAGFLAPRVQRYYLVDADPSDLIEPTEAMLKQAGFTLNPITFFDWCTDPSEMVSPNTHCSEPLKLPCLGDGPHESIECVFSACRGDGDDWVQFRVTDRGEPMQYGPHLQTRLQDPTRSVVRLMDNYGRHHC